MSGPGAAPRRDTRLSMVDHDGSVIRGVVEGLHSDRPGDPTIALRVPLGGGSELRFRFLSRAVPDDSAGDGRSRGRPRADGQPCPKGHGADQRRTGADGYTYCLGCKRKRAAARRDGT